MTRPRRVGFGDELDLGQVLKDNENILIKLYKEAISSRLDQLFAKNWEINFRVPGSEVDRNQREQCTVAVLRAETVSCPLQPWAQHSTQIR